MRVRVCVCVCVRVHGVHAFSLLYHPIGFTEEGEAKIYLLPTKLQVAATARPLVAASVLTVLK